MRVLSVAAAGAIALLLALHVSDLLEYLHRPGDYRFGSEVAGFRYHSASHFLGSSVAEVAIGLFGLMAPRLIARRWAAVATRLGVGLVLVVLAFTLSTK